MFGGDGAYGEAKSALDAVVTRWKAESSWAQRVSLAHALIGWTKGTGLMGHNDAIVGAVEEAGVTTYTTDEMAAMLLDLCDVESKVACGARAAAGRPDRWARRHRARHGRAGREGPRGDGGRGAASRRRGATTGTIRGAAVAAARLRGGAAAGVGRPRRRPRRPGGHRRRRRARAVRLVADPLRDGGRRRAVGGRRARTGLDHRPGQVGGRSRSRAGTTPQTGDLVDEGELVERYHDAVIERVGIREFVDDGAIDPDHASPLLVSVFLDKDFTFVVSSEADARGVRASSIPSTPSIAPVPDSGDWQVTRKAGTEIRVPRKIEAVADRRRADPDRVRSDGVRHQPGHDELDRPAGAVEPRHHRRRVPVRGLHPDRADALGAPQPGGQHAGHRHGRHDVDADHVPRQPARPEQAERHPAGSPAERHCRPRRSVLHRQLRRDDPPGRRVCHRGGVGRGGRRQDPARQGRVRGRRRLRRPDAGGHHRLR